MTVRGVSKELEARLEGGAGGLFSRPSGKLERKSYRDGGERINISLRNLHVPDDSIAVVMADGLELVQLAIRGGARKLDDGSHDKNDFPAMRAGQTIEVVVGAKMVLRGTLCSD